MALLWADSFDHQDKDRYIYPDTYQGTFVTGRNGLAAAAGGAAQIGPDNWQVWNAYFSEVSTDPTLIVGFAFRLNETPLNGEYVLSLLNTSDSRVLRVHADITNGFKGSTASAATAWSGVSITTLKWYYLECKVYMDGSSGTIEFWVDGLKTGDVSGANTLPSSGSANAEWFEMSDNTAVYLHRAGGNPVDVYRVDDLYIFDGSGAACNDVIGDAVVHYMLPASNGVITELDGSDGNQVDNYDQVNESTPSSVDYNGGVTNGIQDLYGLTQLSTAYSREIYGAHLWGVVGKQPGGNAYGRIKIYNPVDDSTGVADIVGLSTAYALQSLPLTLTPAGSTWSTERWNQVQAGFQVFTSTST